MHCRGSNFRGILSNIRYISDGYIIQQISGTPIAFIKLDNNATWQLKVNWNERRLLMRQQKGERMKSIKL